MLFSFRFCGILLFIIATVQCYQRSHHAKQGSNEFFFYSISLHQKSVTSTTRIFAISTGKRFYHNFVQNAHDIFPSSIEALPLIPIDNSVLYWDDAIDAPDCEQIIGAFESSSNEQYEGAVFIDGNAVLDHSLKKNTEINISSLMDTFKWFSVEKLLTKVVSKYLNLYQDKNIIFATQQNPLGDEGFRMKRYMNDGLEHHGYHADSSQDNNKRILAVLIYLNDVTEGGETAFINQGILINPVVGRIAIFPTSFSFVHAGRRPISNAKYVIINFLTV